MNVSCIYIRQGFLLRNMRWMHASVAPIRHSSEDHLAYTLFSREQYEYSLVAQIEPKNMSFRRFWTKHCFRLCFSVSMPWHRCIICINTYLHGLNNKNCLYTIHLCINSSQIAINNNNVRRDATKVNAQWLKNAIKAAFILLYNILNSIFFGVYFLSLSHTLAGYWPFHYYRFDSYTFI